MAIVFEASGTFTTGTATSIELPLPTNAAGELLLAFGYAGLDAGTEGTTLDINETGYGNQVRSDNTAGTDSTGLIESKVSTGGETTALTLQITPGSALYLMGQVFAVSGVHADVWDTAPVMGSSAQDSTTYTCPAITTATNNAVVLIFAHKEGGGTGPFSAPAGYSWLINPATGQGGGNPRFMVAQKLIASPTTETPGAFTGGAATSDWKGFTVALKASTTITTLKLLAHATAASAASIEGVVLNSTRDTVIGEFSGQAFEAALEGGEAVLLIPTSEITPDGSTLTTSDTPIVFAYNATDSIIGPGSATVVEI